jgi:1,6-anhydro-N-acetylmuramate kinase
MMTHIGAVFNTTISADDRDVFGDDTGISIMLFEMIQIY